MPRPAEKQCEIETYLQGRKSKGVTREEFNEKFGNGHYPYSLLLQLVKERKVSKISDRWYWGSPEDWQASIEPGGWIQLNVPSVKAIRKDTFQGYDKWMDKDTDTLRQRAIEGLEDYFMYCRIVGLPFPAFDGELSQDERNEAYRSLLNVSRRMHEYFNQ